VTEARRQPDKRELCVVCRTARARRDCPAAGARVCAECCARELRGRRAGCDEQCLYFNEPVAAGGAPTRDQLIRSLNVALALAERGEQEPVNDILRQVFPQAEARSDDDLLARAMLVRTRLLRAVEGPERALQVLAISCQRVPGSYGLALEHAGRLLAAGQPAQALGEASRARDLSVALGHAERLAALQLMAQSLMLLKRFSDALPLLDEALTLAPEDVNSQLERAVLRLETGDPDGAAADAARVLDAGRPLDRHLGMLLARAHEAAGRPAEAARWVRDVRAAENVPQPHLTAYLAHLLTSARDYEAAQREFASLDLSHVPPGLLPAVSAARAVTLHQLDRQQEAVEALGLALVHNPSRIDLEQRLMDALLRTDRISEALRLFLAIHARDPSLLIAGPARQAAQQLARVVAAREGLPVSSAGEIDGALFILAGEHGPEVKIYRSIQDVPRLFDDHYRAAFGLGVPTGFKVEFLQRTARQLRLRGNHAAAADLLEVALAELQAVTGTRTSWDHAVADVLDRCGALWPRLPRRYQLALLQNEAGLAAARDVGSPDLTAFANEYFRITELLLDEKFVQPLHNRLPQIGFRHAGGSLTAHSFCFRIRQPKIREEIGHIVPLDMMDRLSSLLEQVLNLRVSTHGWVSRGIEQLRDALLGSPAGPGALHLISELGRMMGDSPPSSSRGS